MKESKKQTVFLVIFGFILVIIAFMGITINTASDKNHTENNIMTNASTTNTTKENSDETEQQENIISETSATDTKQLKEKEMQNLYFTNTNIRWGMSEEELNDVEILDKNYGYYENADGKTVRYYYSDYNSANNIYDIDEIQYWVYADNSKLNSYVLKINDYGYTYDNYQEIKKALIKKYGKPTKENLDFNDKTYQKDLEKAIEYGYLDIKTTWTNQDKFDIIVQWSNDLCSVTYCQKGYKGNY